MADPSTARGKRVSAEPQRRSENYHPGTVQHHRSVLSSACHRATPLTPSTGDWARTERALGLSDELFELVVGDHAVVTVVLIGAACSFVDFEPLVFD